MSEEMEIVSAKLDALRMELAARMNEAGVAIQKRIEAEDAYATAKAESVGVRIGSVVTVISKIGYSKPPKYSTRRYRVARIKFCSYKRNEITLFGVTLRKDGTDGELVEIWRDWELEKATP